MDFEPMEDFSSGCYQTPINMDKSNPQNHQGLTPSLEDIDLDSLVEFYDPDLTNEDIFQRAFLNKPSAANYSTTTPSGASIHDTTKERLREKLFGSILDFKPPESSASSSSRVLSTNSPSTISQRTMQRRESSRKSRQKRKAKEEGLTVHKQQLHNELNVLRRQKCYMQSQICSTQHSIQHLRTQLVKLLSEELKSSLDGESISQSSSVMAGFCIHFPSSYSDMPNTSPTVHFCSQCHNEQIKASNVLQ